MKSTPVHRAPLLLLFFLLLGLLTGPPASADTTVGGTISTDTTWTVAGSPYIVTSNITVKGTDGADGITTLTIEPGAELRFNNYQQLNVGDSSGDPGALKAQGTVADPIVFTSSNSSPAPGNWRGIKFYNTTDDATTIMEHCTVEYAGYGNQGQVYVNSATPNLNNCTFAHSSNYDLYYYGTVGGTVSGCTLNSGIYLLATSTVDFTGNTFNQNNSYPIKAYPDNVHSLANGNTFANLDADSYLYVGSGTLTKDATWSGGIPYLIFYSLTVKGTDGADGITTLTIEPGAELRFNNYVQLNVGATSGDPGALKAQGTAAAPIVFTSSNGTPAPGNWRGIKFYTTTDDATTIMEHCSVEYAGYGNQGQVYVNGAAPSLGNCTFTNSSNYDLYYYGTVGGTVSGCTLNSGIYLLASSTVDFTGNTFNQNNSWPMKAYADNVGAIVSGNTFNNLDGNSFVDVSVGTVSHDATWTSAIPYAIGGNITVKGTDGADGITTLTIQPGAVLKFNQSIYMYIGASSGDPGALVAQGTASEPIVFTSNKAAPAAGDWRYILFYNTADDATTVMYNCVVEYSGYTTGAVYLNNASPKILNTTIRNSNSAGIYAYGSGSASATINCNTLVGNERGIHWTVSPPPEMHNNNFIGNTSYGLYYTGSQELNAEDNWWNDSAGPNQTGDGTYGNVDADPWSAQENICTGQVPNKPPNTPSNPSPADAAVHVAASPSLSLNWAGGDPNPLDTVTYDLYWGSAADALQLEAADLAQNAYTKSSLNQGATYYWQVVAKDDKGAQTPGPVWHFTADGDPPDLVISAVTANPPGNLQSGQTVTFTANVQNSGSGPVVDAFTVDFRIDTVSIGTVNVDPILPAGGTVQVSRTWTYGGGDPTVEVAADHQSQVSETDEQNNTFSASLSQVADNTPPALVGASPADGAYLKQVSDITVTLADTQSSVDDTAVINSFAVVDGSSSVITGAVSESNDTFTFMPGVSPMTDGTYTVSLTAADAHGNTQTYTFAFTVDNQPPAKPGITGAAVTSGAIGARPVQNIADQFEVDLTGTRDPGTSVWINGIEQVGFGDAPWSVPVGLQPGGNAIEIWLVDRAGNIGPSEWVDIDAQTSAVINFEYNAAGRAKRIGN